MRIRYISPCALDKHYGKEINDYVKRFDDDDWIVVMDYDTIILTPNYCNLIKELIETYPDAGIITCRTNRTGKRIEQRYDGIISENSDISHWREVAIKEYKKGLQVEEMNRWIAGYLMIFSKKTWEDNKFNEELEIMKVDKVFSSNILRKGKKILISQGLFCFHYYRLLEGKRNINHLI